MEQINRTLQIISIQHELAMNIGLELQLEKMLYAFMERAQHRLSLSSLIIAYDKKVVSTCTQNACDAEEWSCIQYPIHNKSDCAWIAKTAKNSTSQEQAPYSYVEKDDHHYYTFIVPQFGLLVLERKHQPIERMVLEALIPLMSKLAISCLASVEHQRLIEEIDARSKAEQLLVQQSLLDPLTELPNRRMLSLSLDKALANAQRNGNFGAVFFIDLDRFKVINDSLGHGVGDEVLKIVGRRFLQCIREGDTLARMGGDEFVLLVVDLSNDKASAIHRATSIAEKLSSLIAHPINIDGHNVAMSVSTGITLFPVAEDAHLSIEQQGQALMKNADLAMYKIKRTNRNGYSFFSKALQSYSEKRTEIEKHLQSAVKNDEFALHYQPLIGLDGEVVGAEGLLRWDNKLLGRVSPADFISVAEESGLIVDIGNWVVDEVCRLIKSIDGGQLAATPNYLSVNVSPRQFSQPDFVETLLMCIKTHGIDAKRLRVEITEGVAMDNIELAIAKIQKLKLHDVVCMLDDFGSGYSSLSYLHKLPLHTIKVDRSFISGIDTSKDHQVIVDSIVAICNHFSLECVVEGVETEGEQRYLASKKLTAFQGYYFHKPMPEEEFVNLLMNISKN